MNVVELLAEKIRLTHEMAIIDKKLILKTDQLTIKQWVDYVDKSVSVDTSIMDEYEMLTQETYYDDQELWQIMSELECSVDAGILTQARSDKFLRKLKSKNIGTLIVT